MSGHTPGPWTHQPGNRDILAGSHRATNEEPNYWRTIAEAARIGPAPEHDKEMQANIRLIANAPDLLAAAKGVVKLDKAWGDYPESEGHHWQEEMAMALERLAAAVEQMDPVTT